MPSDCRKLWPQGERNFPFCKESRDHRGKGTSLNRLRKIKGFVYHQMKKAERKVEELRS